MMRAASGIASPLRPSGYPEPSQSPWNLILVLIPLGLVHISLRNYMKLRHEAKKTFENIAEMLAVRDPYTYEHSKDVANLAGKISLASWRSFM